MFLNRSGSPCAARRTSRVENGELVFQSGTAGAPDRPGLSREARGRPAHRPAHDHGRRRTRTRQRSEAPPPPPPTERVVNWIGVRPPAWPGVNANGTHTYGTPVALFDGKSLDAFGVQIANRPLGWTIADGVATNQAGANNLVSKEKFTDFKIEAEYKLATEEQQRHLPARPLRAAAARRLHGHDDAATSAGTWRSTAARPTDVSASKPAGEWQTMEAIIVGNRVTVTLNGQRVHDNAVIDGHHRRRARQQRTGAGTAHGPGRPHGRRVQEDRGDADPEVMW